MAKDVKLSSKIQPLVYSRINEMIVMQKTNIDAIVKRKLCPDVIPEYSTNTVQFVSLYWEIETKDEKVVCDFYLKFREKGRYYCAATSTNFPVSFFVAPFYVGTAKKTPKIQRLAELALNDEDMFNRLKDILCERFPGISRSYIEQSRNVTVCEILPDENKPCEQSISVDQFLEGYQNNYLAIYNSKVADMVNDKYPEGSTLHFKFGGLKLNRAYGGSVSVSYRLLLDGEYISSVYKIGTFSYPVLASAYMEDIVQDFEVKCTRQIIKTAYELRPINERERYDLSVCFSNIKNGGQFAAAAQVLDSYFSAYTSDNKNNYLSFSRKHGERPMRISLRGDQYYLILEDTVLLPLEPANAPLEKQHIVDDYDLDTDPRQVKIPSDIFEWLKFCKYLSSVYQKQIEEKGLSDVPVRINVSLYPLSARFNIAETSLTFGEGKKLPSVMDINYSHATDNAYELAAALSQIAVKKSGQAANIMKNCSITAVEAIILTYIQHHPGAYTEEVRGNIRAKGITGSSIPSVLRDVRQSKFVRSASVQGKNGNNHIQVSIVPECTRIGFNKYVRPYDLRDIAYLTPSMKEHVIKEAIIDQDEDHVMQAFIELLKLPRVILISLCQNADVIKRFNALSPDNINYIKAALARAIGDKATQAIFAKREEQALETLMVSEDKDIDALADLIMNTGSRTVNYVFNTQQGQRFLRNCSNEDLEIIADTLFCIEGCDELYTQINRIIVARNAEEAAQENASQPSPCNFEKRGVNNMSDMMEFIKNSNPTQISRFFNDAKGKRFLERCNTEQLTTIANALSSVKGCRSVCNEINDMLFLTQSGFF